MSSTTDLVASRPAAGRLTALRAAGRHDDATILTAGHGARFPEFSYEQVTA